MDPKAFWNAVFEFGQLRRVKHEGWRLAGVEHPESVADHSLRAAQIGYVLARLEGYANPAEVCTMVVFHDIGEARVGDIHKVANRYVTVDEEGAVSAQLAGLGGVGEEIFDLWVQAEKRSSTAGVIAKDADLLEMAACAKEYIERGYTAAQDWIDNISATLRTASARRLLATLAETGSCAWWDGLKKF